MNLFRREESPFITDVAQYAGNFRGTTDGLMCWEINDPDKEPFKDILEAACLSVSECRSIPRSTLLLIDIFLRGRTLETSVAYVMLAGSTGRQRKAAVKHLRRSPVLRHYAGLKIGQWDWPPLTSNITMVGKKEKASDEGLVYRCPKFDIQRLPYATAENTSDGSKASLLSITATNNTDNIPRSGTLSGVVIVGQISFLVAPAHIFMPRPPEDHDVDDEVSLESDSGSEILRAGSATSSEVDSESPLSKGSESITDEVIQIGLSNTLKGGVERPNSSRGSPASEDFNIFSQELDYALIPVPLGHTFQKELLSISPQNIQQIIPGQVPVSVTTPSHGLMHGLLDGRFTLMRLPYSSRFSRFYPVTLPNAVCEGDCGSLVVVQNTKQIYGFIVAASMQGKVAYIVSADEILLDMTAKLNQERSRELPPSTQGSLVSQMSSKQQMRQQDEVLEIIHHIQRVFKFSTWSPALRAAPEAIIVMAVCLKAASHHDTKAIPVGQSWAGRDGKMINFPSKFLDTNLQYCSDLGRAAFRAAESGMRKLSLNLENILGPHGTLRHIVRLFDKPKTAKYQLRDTMEQLEASAVDCKDNAEAIRQQFDRMLEFTMALHKATQNKRGATSHEQGENEKKTSDEEKNIVVYQRDLEMIKKERTKHEDALGHALDALKVAENAVLEANEAALNSGEPSSVDEIDRIVRGNNPDFQSGDGILKKSLHYHWGKSRLKEMEDRRDERAVNEARAPETKELLKVRQGGIDKNQKQALKALEIARKRTIDCQQGLDSSTERFRSTSEELLAASKSLDESHRILSQLGTQKIDLAETQKIIKTSLESLTTFKHQIDEMLSFFDGNAAYVKKLTSPNGVLGTILSRIEGVSKSSGNAPKARIISNIEFDSDDREELLEHILQLEGRFSLVYEIAALYLEVSRVYIIPGINMMEQLAILSDGEYNQMEQKFSQFCRDAKFGIERMSSTSKERELGRKIGQNMWLMAAKTKMVENKPYPGDVEDPDEVDEAEDEEESEPEGEE